LQALSIKLSVKSVVLGSDMKIALVGPGLVGKKHLDLLSEITAVSIVGVVEPGATSAANYSSEWLHFASLQELLQNRAPDGVIIASPTQFHCEQASILIEASIPVLVEKPVGRSANEIRHLMQRAKLNNVPVCVGHHRIHGSLFRRLRDFVWSNEFGFCHHFISKTIFRKPPFYWEEKAWRTLPENGGVIGINVIHEIDLSQRLFGPIMQVFCDLIDHPNFAGLASRGQALVRFKNGTQGCFIFSDGSASTASWELTTGENRGFVQHYHESCYEFYFADGYFKFPEFRFVRGHDLDWLSPHYEHQIDREPDDPLENQIKHFLAVVRGEEQPKVSLEDALQSRLVMDAMFQSAASHEWVSVS
jgi:predicted dehydrogenase